MTIDPIELADSASSKMASPRVLVVDDNSIDRRILMALMTHAGCQVSTATTGLDALVAASAHTFDLVLLDLGLPDIDGLTVCRQIRALPGGSNASPVVAVSAASVREWPSMRQAGFDALLIKPADRMKLSHLFRTWLPDFTPLAPPPANEYGEMDVAMPGEERAISEDFDTDRLAMLRGGALGDSSGYVDEMIGDFLVAMPRHLNAQTEALVAGDRKALKMQAHSVKGMGGNLGTKRLALVAEELMDLAESCDDATAEKLIADMWAAYRDAETYFTASRRRR